MTLITNIVPKPFGAILLHVLLMLPLALGSALDVFDKAIPEADKRGGGPFPDLRRRVFFATSAPRVLEAFPGTGFSSWNVF